MIDTEMESGYQCNCGHSFALRYMGIFGFNVKYYGQCPKCKARIFEYRAARQRKEQLGRHLVKLENKWRKNFG